LGRVDAVKMDRMGMGAAVGKVDPDAVAFGAANGRAGNAAIVSPGRELNAGHNLNRFVHGHKIILSYFHLKFNP